MQACRLESLTEHRGPGPAECWCCPKPCAAPYWHVPAVFQAAMRCEPMPFASYTPASPSPAAEGWHASSPLPVVAGIEYSVGALSGSFPCNSPCGGETDPAR